MTPPNQKQFAAHRFDDDSMAQFIARGFVTFEPELPADFHEFVHRQIQATIISGNPGNNILPLVPELQTVLDEPRVRGALESIMGKNYSMHPHRHCHLNKSGSDGQRLHKDAFSVRFHRIQEALVFYYPHDVTQDMGPTAIIPGSQYHGKQLDNEMPDELPVCGKAGTVTVAHYDLWHRGTPNRSSNDRYMVKFLFTRMSQPEEPSWDSDSIAREDFGDPRWKDLHSTIWDWHCGNQSLPESEEYDPVPLLKQLGDINESVRLRSAYRLGRMGKAIVPLLTDKLRSADAEVRHAAGYALSAIGPVAVDPVVATLRETDHVDRVIAAEVLGNIGSTAAVPELIRLLSAGAAAEKNRAADSLGKISDSAEQSVPALLQAINSDEQEEVRGSATLAISRLAPDSTEAVTILEAALANSSWYVRGLAVEALARIGSNAARTVLMDHLRTAHWCSVAARS